MKNFKYKKHPEHTKHFIKRAVAWFAMFIFMCTAVFMVNMNYSDFHASIIPSRNVPDFDGTVLPVRKAPDWVALSSAEYNYSYSQLSQSKLINIPEYDPDKLIISTDNLTWGNPQHDAIRNAKITYSVPYMGNYRLDGREYAGSHLAIDIKLPEGTPVYAIANGRVEKVSLINSGFGNHIVIEHQNAPTLNNPQNTETLYSSYSHLNSVNVSEGSIVKKGDLIGYSGDSGLSTTPHLHFQIDRDTSDWHPYWPFTSHEAASAGMSFTDAINNGLNQNKAIANTVNPMLFVQKYLDETSYDYEDSIYEEHDDDEEKKDEVLNPPDPPSSDKVISEDEYSEDENNEIVESELIVADFEIISPITFEPREPTTVKIKALDAKGNVLKDYSPKSSIRVEVKRGSAEIEPKRLNSNDFKNGEAKIIVTSRSTRPVQLRIKSDTIIKDSETMSEHSLFADIGEIHPHYKAIRFLKNEGIIEGYPDGTFKPDNVVSRVEVIKFILEGIGSDLKYARTLKFSDTNLNEWYAGYLYTAMENGIVDGYPDGTFKPSNSVKKVEFLKMLIESMNIDVNPNVGRFTFTDVNEDEWYAPYVKFAIDKNLIDVEGRQFKPNEEMSREQVAEAIYRVKILTETGESKFSANIANEFEANFG